MISLHGKVSLVTGSSRGIGAATALLLAQAGSDIVLNCVKESEQLSKVHQEIKKLERNVISHQCNVANSREVGALVERTILEFGKLDIVVNNAGIWTYGEI